MNKMWIFSLILYCNPSKVLWWK